MEKLVIPTDLINQDNSYAMVAYIALQIVLNPGNGNVLICPEWVGKVLEYEIPLSKKKREKINAAYKYLVGIGYLSKRGKYYLVDTDLFYHYKSFMRCDRSVFEELCCAPKLLRHYLVLKDCVGQAFSLEYYANREGVAPATISRYNKDLVALHLIEIHSSTYNPAGGKRNCNNTYTVLN